MEKRLTTKSFLKKEWNNTNEQEENGTIVIHDIASA